MTNLRIDSHHHIWDLELQPQAWISGDEMAVVAENFDMSDYRKVSKGTGIEKSILCQTSRNTFETKQFLALAEVDPTIAGVIGWIDIDGDDISYQIEKYESLNAKKLLVGVREMAQDISDNGFLARPNVIKNVQTLGSLNCVYDLLIKPPQMEAAIKLVRSAPATMFVVDHMAKPEIADKVMEPWASYMETLASLPNTVCKVSGLVTEARWDHWRVADFEPYFDLVLNSFGPSRMMFGSDWPVALLGATYKEVVHVAETLSSCLSKSELNHFWSQTAATTYGIEISSVSKDKTKVGYEMGLGWP